ncbi:hypothetical protein EOE67_10590 [Rheinheimera riviphila]|uniref:Uncharacterized protein n=1 Tax=Rheinheimera riviphila TaxID=1834037 RepID=A0A437QS33_9GAMM|nr:hypothetical protein [Rheinheimera riviphila]RVU37326.1 hypothetical protein EOE67_10590 [Rheinheimera riviphila]
MRISRSVNSKQSRLAGFFLLALLLTACTEPQQTAASSTFSQAQQAEQQGLISQALPLYQQAAATGDTKAVAAVLRLRQSITSVAELSHWLQSLPLMETERQPFLAQLGLWQQLPASEVLRYQQQWQKAFSKMTAPIKNKLQQRTTADEPHCALHLQPVLSTAQSALQWLQLSKQWQQDPQLSTLALCFKAPVFIDSQQLACSELRSERIQCDAAPLKELVLQSGATQLLVLAGQGGASYNNGWLQLPETASLPLFRHELSHLFGFIDEYPLAGAIAADECVSGRITPNVLFSKDDLPAYLARWQLNAADIQLTAVESCKHTAQQAYRVVSADSHLQHYELPVPDLYLKLMQQQLQQPEQLMPVAYYFAYLARQQQDWAGWQQLMQLAARAGYPPAKQALAEAAGNGVRQSVR